MLHVPVEEIDKWLDVRHVIGGVVEDDVVAGRVRLQGRAQFAWPAPVGVDAADAGGQLGLVAVGHGHLEAASRKLGYQAQADVPISAEDQNAHSPVPS